MSGPVSVFGDSADPELSTNAAITFDATCDGGCTGGDDDLKKPALGNVLIIGEDLVDDDDDGLVDDPDDASLGGSFFDFDFSGWGPGIVRVVSIDVLDTEDGGSIELFSGGVKVGTVAIPTVGDNELRGVPIDVSGVDFMRVTVDGSAAIDNISLEVD